MKTFSYSFVNANLAKTFQQVCDDHTPIKVTRSNADPVIIISLADYEAMQETLYLMRNPINATRLVNAINEIENHIK